MADGKGDDVVLRAAVVLALHLAVQGVHDEPVGVVRAEVDVVVAGSEAGEIDIAVDPHREVLAGAILEGKVVAGDGVAASAMVEVGHGFRGGEAAKGRRIAGGVDVVVVGGVVVENDAARVVVLLVVHPRIVEVRSVEFGGIRIDRGERGLDDLLGLDRRRAHSHRQEHPGQTPPKGEDGFWVHADKN